MKRGPKYRFCSDCNGITNPISTHEPGQCQCSHRAKGIRLKPDERAAFRLLRSRGFVVTLSR